MNLECYNEFEMLEWICYDKSIMLQWICYNECTMLDWLYVESMYICKDNSLYVTGFIICY